MDIKQEIKLIHERLAVLEQLLGTKQYDWDTAPVIYQYNGVEYRMGPTAEEPMSWHKAKQWCQSVGGELPDRETMLACQILKLYQADKCWTSVEGNTGMAWIHDFKTINSFPVEDSLYVNVFAIKRFEINKEK